MQKIFNPINYEFSWTDDGWYDWNSDAAHKTALSARDKLAKELRAQGHKVKGFSLRNQLVRRGGISTGHPDVEFFVTCYGLNAD